MKPDSEHPDVLERKGQTRLMADLGPREVPKRREKRPDKGHMDLPLFEQEDERQLRIADAGVPEQSRKT